MLRHALAASAILFGLTVGANALPVAPQGMAAEAPIVEVQGRHHGRHHGWRGHPKRHHGWHRGHHRGWQKHHRRHHYRHHHRRHWY